MTAPSDDLEFLLSRAADPDVSAEERARIAEAARRDAQAAKSVRGYERLGAILRAFRAIPKDLDVGNLAAGTSRRVAEAQGAPDAAPGDMKLDALLARSVRPLPPMDWHAFRSRVSDAVHAEEGPQIVRRGGHVRRWLLRAAVPLAAAAAVMLMVRTPRTSLVQVDVGYPAIERPVISVRFEQPGTRGVVSISFDRTASPAGIDEEQADAGVAIATGTRRIDAPEPLDVALLF